MTHPALPSRTTSLLLALLLAGAAPLPAQAVQQHATTAQHKRHPKPAAAKTDYVGEYVNFAEWKEVGLFIDEMAARHGFERSALAALMSQVRYVDATIQLIKPAPPGKPKNWQAYSQLFIEPVRIDTGVRFWNDNAEALARAEAAYGVPAEIIVGIIGVETVYGRNTGRFRVLDALTTLAFSYPETPNRTARMAFFRGELESALLYARQNGIEPLSLLGSYAGAIGLPQFMPSSIIEYATDFDGDGQVDLRNSAVDAIGSVASFLSRHGWQRNDPGPLVYQAAVSPARGWEALLGAGLSATFSEKDLAAAGVSSSAPLAPGMPYGLIDLQNGAEPTEYWLATRNFFAITQYNRSYFYAMSVVQLGRAVRLSRAL